MTDDYPASLIGKALLRLDLEGMLRHAFKVHQRLPCRICSAVYQSSLCRSDRIGKEAMKTVSCRCLVEPPHRHEFSGTWSIVFIVYV